MIDHRFTARSDELLTTAELAAFTRTPGLLRSILASPRTGPAQVGLDLARPDTKEVDLAERTERHCWTSHAALLPSPFLMTK
jgi:hypothetical protein